MVRVVDANEYTARSHLQGCGREIPTNLETKSLGLLRRVLVCAVLLVRSVSRKKKKQ